MNKYAHPNADIDAAMLAFPANVVGSLLPLRHEIPDDYPDKAKWIKLQARWFFEGIAGIEFDMQDGINNEEAFTHLACCQRSYQPKHEHKAEGVAWLMSLWIRDFKETQ